MADKHVDALTGTETTGHEWDGLRELNTPLPTWWLYTFYATILFSVVWTILFPAWPTGLHSYTRGILGYSTRETLAENMAQLRAERAQWQDRLAAASLEDIAKDPQLLQFAMAGGRSLFADNCAPCHGAGGAGRPGGYPILADDDWIWGGTLAAIEQTIQHGIRNNDPEARVSEMPAFGADGLLKPDEIQAVAGHVLFLAGAGPDDARGAKIFAEQCVACHGEDGKGISDVGGPNLTDAIWLYGGNKAQIVTQIAKPRQGVMPHWKDRLDPAAIKQLAIYVHSLGGGQ